MGQDNNKRLLNSLMNNIKFMKNRFPYNMERMGWGVHPDDWQPICNELLQIQQITERGQVPDFIKLNLLGVRLFRDEDMPRLQPDMLYADKDYQL